MNQIIGHVLRKKDVPGVAAIHHSLRHVDAGPGDVGAPAYIGHLAHPSAVNAHPHRKFRMLLQCFRNLQRAPGRFLHAAMENQRHSVARRQPDQLFVRCLPHRRGAKDDLRQLIQPLLLFFY
ncbi:MAG TPA: hypothetical protein VGM65_10190 [Candidatus Udaeobacter sp.]